MVIQRLDDDTHAFLILDDQGRVIGRVVDTDYPLDRVPPEDTVFMSAPSSRPQPSPRARRPN
jgi:hypothetical protein